MTIARLQDTWLVSTSLIAGFLPPVNGTRQFFASSVRPEEAVQGRLNLFTVPEHSPHYPRVTQILVESWS